MVDNNAIFLVCNFIKWLTAYTAESKSSTITLSQFTSSEILSNITIGIPSAIASLKCLKSCSACVSSAIESIKPSIVPLLSISIACSSFFNDSLDIQVITLYPLSLAAFSIPLNTFAKNGLRILGIITPMVLERLLFKFTAILLGL